MSTINSDDEDAMSNGACVICFNGPSSDKMWTCTTCSTKCHTQCISRWAQTNHDRHPYSYTCPDCRQVFELSTLPDSELNTAFQYTSDFDERPLHIPDTVAYGTHENDRDSVSFSVRRSEPIVTHFIANILRNMPMPVPPPPIPPSFPPFYNLARAHAYANIHGHPYHQQEPGDDSNQETRVAEAETEVRRTEGGVSVNSVDETDDMDIDVDVEIGNEDEDEDDHVDEVDINVELRGGLAGSGRSDGRPDGEGGVGGFRSRSGRATPLYTAYSRFDSSNYEPERDGSHERRSRPSYGFRYSRFPPHARLRETPIATQWEMRNRSLRQIDRPNIVITGNANVRVNKFTIINRL